MARFCEIEGDMPFDTVSPSPVVASTFIFFLLDVVSYPRFGAISGFITASLLVKKPQTGTQS